MPLLPALLLLALPAALAAADYYFSPSGSDLNAGTSPAAAWQSVAKFNSTTWLPGDSARFEGGQSFSGTLTLSNTDAGSSSSPFLITSYGTGRAVIQAGNNAGLSATNTYGVQVRNINFNGSGAASNTQNGVLFRCNLSGGVKIGPLVIEDVDVGNFGRWGVDIDSSHSSKSGYQDVLIQRVDAHDNKLGGITTGGPFSASSTLYSHKNVTLRECRVWLNLGDPAASSHTGSGIILSDVDGALVEYCQAWGNGANCNSGGGGPVGIWCWDANAVTIQHSEAWDNRTGPGSADGGGFDLDGGTTNSVIQYCYSHNNDGAGVLLAQFPGARPFNNNVVRYNVIQNDGREHGYGGLHVWSGDPGAIQDTDLYHNTVYTSTAPSGSPKAFGCISDIWNVRVFNNLFVTNNNLTLVDNSNSIGLTFKGNNYHSIGGTYRFRWAGATYFGLAAWRTGTGQERHAGADTGYSADPMLTAPGTGGQVMPAPLNTLSAYKLMDGSPMVEAGLPLGSVFGVAAAPRDFYGTSPLPFDTKPDIGAHEWNNATATPTFTVSPTPTATPPPQERTRAYPNPVPGGVPLRLRGSLAKPGTVELECFSAAYHKLDKRELGPFPAGIWDVAYDPGRGQPMPNGLYYLMVTTAAGSERLKIFFLR